MNPVKKIGWILALSLMGLSSSLYAIQKPAKSLTPLFAALDVLPAAPAPQRPPRVAFSLKAVGGALRSPALGDKLVAYLKNHPDALGLSATPDLRVDYVHLVPGRNGIADRVYVHLIQTVNGVDVHGTHLSFAFNPARADPPLESFQTALYTRLLTADPDLADPAAAMNRMRNRTHSSRVRPLHRKVRWLGGKWRTVREFVVVDQGLHGAVDGSGQTYLWDDRVYANYSGTVTGRQVDFDPVATGDALTPVALRQLTIADGAVEPVYTGNDGGYSFSTPSNSDVPLGLAGRWSDVNDENGADLTALIPAGSPSPVNLQFNPVGNVETNTAQVNAYQHTAIIHDWLAARGVNPAGIDIPIPVNVNKDAVVCNAYYEAATLNFFKRGGGCINTAYDTIIYHEYGHFVDDQIGGITEGGLSEGWGDIMATYISGQPLVGEGFHGTAGSSVRNGNNDYIYIPNDEVHAAGQAWMGFAWDLRTHLINSLGPARGVALAEDLVIPTLWANSPDIPSAAREVALRDDDDGDLSNGTPHFSAIQAAAAHHGISFNLDSTPPSVTITSPSEGATLSNSVTISGMASDDQALTQVFILVDGVQQGTAMGTTVWVFNLDTTMISNGAHALSAQAIDAAGNTATAQIPITVTNTNTGNAIYDTTLQAPRCSGQVSSCISGNLLNGRGTMTGGAELHQPNTLAASPCADGASGTYHAEESLDRLSVYTMDGTPLAPGKIVFVDALVWAPGRYWDDYLDIYSAANANSPDWRYLGTYSPTRSGSQVLSVIYTLPAGSLQAVRGIFRNGGTPYVCSSGPRDDNDDLVFQVGGGDTIPPSAPTGVQFSNPTDSSLQLSWVASTDNVSVAGYRVDVSTSPSFSGFLPAYNNEDVGSVTTTLVSGLDLNTHYFARVRAYDLASNSSSNSDTAVGTTQTSETIPPIVDIQSPLPGAVLSGLVTVSGTASDNVAIASVTLIVDGVTLGVASGTTFWTYNLDTTGFSNGLHNLIALATDTSGNAAAGGQDAVFSNRGLASYSAVLMAPECSGAGPTCDSGELLNGRGFIFGGRELHQPNTLFSSCADGNSGIHHREESIDRLRIYTVDGSTMAPGKIVRAEATVWAVDYDGSDQLDFFYAADANTPAWTYLTTIQPSSRGLQVLSWTFTLPIGGTLQALRANFRNFGSAIPCTEGQYDDHDDLVFAVGGGSARLNVALASNGGTALASSIYNNDYGVSGAINGDRKGLSWGAGGGWNDSTAYLFPDWLEVDFSGVKTIDEVDVFGVQDAYLTPSEPTPTMTFTNYGLNNFEVQYWNGISWQPVPGATVTGNNLVWRKFNFAPLSTAKIRVWVTATPDSWSRVTELEAWGTDGGPSNNPPAVTLFYPVDGASFSAPATIELAAIASDSDGTINRVDFYANGGLIGSYTFGNPYTLSWTNVYAGSYTLTAVATDNQGAATVSSPVHVYVTGSARLNVALASNGGTAAASSILSSGCDVSGAINGDRTGSPWGAGGGWADGTPGTFPDWLEVDFNGVKTIDEVDVFGVQDAYQTPIEPTPTMTFSSYGLIAFEVQYWDGISWQPVPGGTVTGNNLVWRKFNFAPLSTTKIRVWVTAAPDIWSRVTELEAWGTDGGVSNSPPTVNLINPGEGASFSAPATIDLSATASDSDGTISKVDFYADGALIGGNTAGNPYTFSWTNVSAGSYTLTAVATDNQGAATVSSPVHVYVTGSARLNVALASNGGTAAASSILSSGCDVSGAINGDRTGSPWGAGGGWADGTPGTFPDWLEVDFNGVKTIDEVDVFGVQDAYQTPIEPTPTMTFSSYGLIAFEVQYWDGISWQPVPGGTVTGNNLVWRKFNFAPLSTTKIRVWVTAAPDIWSRVTELEAWGTDGGVSNSPPTVNLINPGEGASFSAPATIDLSATASDSDGTISKVDFYADGALIGGNTAGNPYTFSWTNVSAGSYTLTAVATDNQGAVTTSVPVHVYVTGISDVIWVEDSIPDGATGAFDGGDSWNWVSSNPAPFSGSLASQSTIASGEHQHYFYGAIQTMQVNPGDSLFAYVYLDPANPPSEVMLQWNDGSWEHRAFWGSDSVDWGTPGTESRRYQGPLPPVGQWVRLSVPANLVGLAGHTLNGMAFTLNNGRATWDRAGKTSGAPPTAPTVDLKGWGPPNVPSSAPTDGPITMTYNGVGGLVWTTTHADQCKIYRDGTFVGDFPANGSAGVGPLTTAQTHTIVCTGPGGTSNTDSVTHTVSGSGDDVVWVEDALPAGAISQADGGDSWNWVSNNPAPFSGSLASQSTIASGEHQHYFYDAIQTMQVNPGDSLFAYVYLDPANPPSEVMLQWNDGSWEHRVYWGADLQPWGNPGTESRHFGGPLPPVGQWVKLSVPANLVGLAGHTLNGMAFTLYNGRATWDRAGRTPGIPNAASNQETFVTASGSAASVRVYPNPWRMGRDSGTNINFVGMNPNSTVKIFTISGHSVATLHAPSGSTSWDVRNQSGDQVASGIYLYLITDNQGNRTRGKLAVIR